MYKVIDQFHTLRCVTHCIVVATAFAALCGGRVEVA